MDTPTPQSSLSLKELQHLRHEVKAAGAELCEMIEIGGDLHRVWDQQRKYFVPEIGTCIPFPIGHTWRLAEPVATDRIRRALLPGPHKGNHADIQWLEIARREIIPEKFK